MKKLKVLFLILATLCLMATNLIYGWIAFSISIFTALFCALYAIIRVYEEEDKNEFKDCRF